LSASCFLLCSQTFTPDAAATGCGRCARTSERRAALAAVGDCAAVLPCEALALAAGADAAAIVDDAAAGCGDGVELELVLFGASARPLALLCAVTTLHAPLLLEAGLGGAGAAGGGLSCVSVGVLLLVELRAAAEESALLRELSSFARRNRSAYESAEPFPDAAEDHADMLASEKSARAGAGATLPACTALQLTCLSAQSEGSAKGSQWLEQLVSGCLLKC